MNVARINQTSGVTPANQSYQDNREKNLQKQIANLEEKVKNITYDKEMSAEEKSDEKKKLQEKMQSLNSELKQYQVQKQQEEDAKQQAVQHAARLEASRKTAENVSSNSDPVSNSGDDDKRKTDETDEKSSDRGNASSGVILSISNTKDQLAGMHKIRKDLEGRMRTAETDEEKSDLQKRIDSVSKNMGEKIRKISDTITDNLKDEEERKDKVQKIQKEQEDRMKKINVVVPNGGSAKPANDAYRKENFMISGDVSIS